MAFVIQNLIVVKKAVGVCKCNPLPEKFEFIIQDSGNYSNNTIEISQEDSNYYNTDQLKEKTICDFLHILDQLECGIQPDLEIILEEISLINIYG